MRNVNESWYIVILTPFPIILCLFICLKVKKSQKNEEVQTTSMEEKSPPLHKLSSHYSQTSPSNNRTSGSIILPDEIVRKFQDIVVNGRKEPFYSTINESNDRSAEIEPDSSSMEPEPYYQVNDIGADVTSEALVTNRESGSLLYQMIDPAEAQDVSLPVQQQWYPGPMPDLPYCAIGVRENADLIRVRLGLDSSPEPTYYDDPYELVEDNLVDTLDGAESGGTDLYSEIIDVHPSSNPDQVIDESEEPTYAQILHGDHQQISRCANENQQRFSTGTELYAEILDSNQPTDSRVAEANIMNEVPKYAKVVKPKSSRNRIVSADEETSGGYATVVFVDDGEDVGSGTAHAVNDEPLYDQVPSRLSESSLVDYEVIGNGAVSRGSSMPASIPLLRRMVRPGYEPVD